MSKPLDNQINIINSITFSQTNTKIIVVLQIPLVNLETYIHYNLYPLPVEDARTGLGISYNSYYYKIFCNDNDSVICVTFENLDNN